MLAPATVFNFTTCSFQPFILQPFVPNRFLHTNHIRSVLTSNRLFILYFLLVLHSCPWPLPSSYLLISGVTPSSFCLSLFLICCFSTACNIIFTTCFSLLWKGIDLTVLVRPKESSRRLFNKPPSPSGSSPRYLPRGSNFNRTYLPLLPFDSPSCWPGDLRPPRPLSSLSFGYFGPLRLCICPNGLYLIIVGFSNPWEFPALQGPAFAPTDYWAKCGDLAHSLFPSLFLNTVFNYLIYHHHILNTMFIIFSIQCSSYLPCPYKVFPQSPRKYFISHCSYLGSVHRNCSIDFSRFPTTPTSLPSLCVVRILLLKQLMASKESETAELSKVHLPFVHLLPSAV